MYVKKNKSKNCDVIYWRKKKTQGQREWNEFDKGDCQLITHRTKYFIKFLIHRRNYYKIHCNVPDIPMRIFPSDHELAVVSDSLLNIFQPPFVSFPKDLSGQLFLHLHICKQDA